MQQVDPAIGIKNLHVASWAPSEVIAKEAWQNGAEIYFDAE